MENRQENFSQEFSERLREFRNKSNISAREMSISLGQNVNYINLIENGKRMPSMQGFFSICEYLNVTPSEFFGDVSVEKPQAQIQSKILEVISSLSARQVESIVNMILELKQ